MSDKPKLSVTDIQKRFHAAALQVKIAKTSGVFGGKTKATRNKARKEREKSYLFA